ncbi:hypothetical protein [Pseudarthrobacter sp. LT1]|uniref:hypothetical protein n=1 Tax=Pseudarthrobacter sp. LT1 TaxID=3111450 RepID=UPI003B63E48D
MPSLSGVYSIRRSAAPFTWRFSIDSGWWRSRHPRTLARNRDGTSSPGAAPRAGFGAAGSKKCATSFSAPSEVRPSVSSAMMRACCHDITPEARASKANGREQIRRDCSTNAPAAAELMVRTPAISSTTDMSAYVRSSIEAPGGVIACWNSTASTASRAFTAPSCASSRAKSSRRSSRIPYRRCNASTPAQV